MRAHNVVWRDVIERIVEDVRQKRKWNKEKKWKWCATNWIEKKKPKMIKDWNYRSTQKERNLYESGGKKRRNVSGRIRIKLDSFSHNQN